jgi:hypothetical protein
MNFSNHPYYIPGKPLDDKTKSKIFTFDSKVFIRSLSDAVTCTRQVAQINCSKELYLNKVSILDTTLRNGSLLLAKFCDHDICNANIIASTNINSYYNYFMMKFSINLYLNFYEKLKEATQYDSLSNELDKIHEGLRNDLLFLTNQIKRRNFILTKDEHGNVDEKLE